VVQDRDIVTTLSMVLSDLHHYFSLQSMFI